MIFYSFKLCFYKIIKSKKISLKKYAWSFCMGSLPLMVPVLTLLRARSTENAPLLARVQLS